MPNHFNPTISKHSVFDVF